MSECSDGIFGCKRCEEWEDMQGMLRREETIALGIMVVWAAAMVLCLVFL